MNCFEALSAQDRANIKNYIELFGGANASSIALEADLDYLLRFWNKNKMNLFHMFGEKLILEKEICIEKPRSIMYNDMVDAIYQDEELTFVRAFNDWCWQFRNRDWQEYHRICSLIDVNSLLDNCYDDAFFTIPNPKSSHPIQIQTGAKIMRILSKIADAYNLPGFEEFRVAHSMVLNQKKFNGTICLSIHPLDYMTMSDNDCDWTSCMSWTSPGEYRMGTVECMNSPYIVVAYMKDKKDCEFADWNETKKIVWNNKRWRKLFAVTPDLLVGIKGYPFEEAILDDVCLDELKSRTPYTYLDEKYKITNNRYAAKKYNEVYANVNFRIMYNDFYSGHIGYASARLVEGEYDPDLCLSGETECMTCGDNITDIFDEINASFVDCPSCNGLARCPECGCYVDEDDLVNMKDGRCMCSNCAEEYTFTCPICNQVEHYDYSETIFLRHLGEEEAETCICDECFKDKVYEAEWGPIEETTEDSKFWWDTIRTKRYVDSKNCTERGFKWFNFWGFSLGNIMAEVRKNAYITPHFDENGNPL